MVKKSWRKLCQTRLSLSRKYHREGDISKGICEDNCRGWVTTTLKRGFKLRYEGTVLDVPDGLGYFCDTCGALVSTPPEATKFIKKAIAASKAAA